MLAKPTVQSESILNSMNKFKITSIRMKYLHPHNESQTVTSYFSSHSAILSPGLSDITAAPAQSAKSFIVLALASRQPKQSLPSREQIAEYIHQTGAEHIAKSSITPKLSARR